MKIIILLLFTGSVFASNNCDSSNTKIYGEASSFEKVSGKVVKVTEKYLIPKSLSEHIGTYENLVITSKSKLKSLVILEKEIPLKPDVGFYRTVDFNLFKVLDSQNIEGPFEIQVIGLDNHKCTKKYKVIISE